MRHARLRRLLGDKALFASGVIEAGCLAHARRKFHELWVNHKNSVGEQALSLFGKLYEIEREVVAVDAERRRPFNDSTLRTATFAASSSPA